MSQNNNAIGNPRDTMIMLIIGGLLCFGPFIAREMGYGQIMINMVNWMTS